MSEYDIGVTSSDTTLNPAVELNSNAENLSIKQKQNKSKIALILVTICIIIVLLIVIVALQKSSILNSTLSIINNGSTNILNTTNALNPNQQISSSNLFLYVKSDKYLSIVNISNYNVIKRIPVATSFFVMSPNENFAYIVGNTTSTSFELYLFNTSNHTIIKELKINGDGLFPRSLDISPSGEYTYLLAGSNSASILYTIDTVNNSVIKTFNLTNIEFESPVHAGYGELSPDGKYLFVNDFNSQNFLVINVFNDSIINITNTTTHGCPISGSAFSNDNNFYTIDACGNLRVFKENGYLLKDINIVSNSTMGTFNIEFSPNNKYFFIPEVTNAQISTNSYGYLIILNTTNYSVLKTIPTSTDFEGMSFSSDGKYIYMMGLNVYVYAPNQIPGSIDNGTISIINASNFNLIKTINLTPILGEGGVISPNGRYAYMSHWSLADPNPYIENISVVNIESGTIIKNITIGTNSSILGLYK